MPPQELAGLPVFEQRRAAAHIDNRVPGLTVNPITTLLSQNMCLTVTIPFWHNLHASSGAYLGRFVSDGMGLGKCLLELFPDVGLPPVPLGTQRWDEMLAARAHLRAHQTTQMILISVAFNYTAGLIIIM